MNNIKIICTTLMNRFGVKKYLTDCIHVNNKFRLFLPCEIAVTPVERTTNLAREMVMKSACLNSSGIRLSRIPIILGSCFRLLPGFFRRRLFFSFRRFLMRNRFCQLRRRCCWRLFEPEPPRLLASTSRFDRR